MKTFFPLLTASLLILAAPACVATAPKAAEQPDDSIFRAVYAQFSLAYREADPALVAELYTQDAFYLQPDSDIFRGRDSIQLTFAQFLDRFTPGQGPTIQFDIIERQIRGDIGYDIGYYRFGDGPRSGKFIVLWQRESDGRWRIRADGYSAVTQ